MTWTDKKDEVEKCSFARFVPSTNQYSMIDWFYLICCKRSSERIFISKISRSIYLSIF